MTPDDHKPNSPMKERLMTADEVAEMLRVSKQFVWDHSNGRHNPPLRRVQMGGSVRFRLEDVHRFIEVCLSADDKERKR